MMPGLPSSRSIKRPFSTRCGMRMSGGFKKSKNSKPFDEDKAWDGITGLASFYFRQYSVKQQPMTASKLVPRLHKLKEALGEARTLVDEAMQGEVGGALYASWCEANAYFRHDPDGEPALASVRFKVFDPVRTKNEFDKVFAGLATLENAASRAADDVPATKRGRHPILSRDDIWNLAALYRDSTGLIPGTGDWTVCQICCGSLDGTRPLQ